VGRETAFPDNAAAGSEDLKTLGSEVVEGLRFACSDMWKSYLKVTAAQAKQAVHVLDRFHITTHLNQAVDQVRRSESSRLRVAGKAKAERLKHMRWPLLRRGSRVRGRARQKLNALLASKLATPEHGISRNLSSTFGTRSPSVRHLGRSVSGLLV
jgi:transposase